MMPSKTASGSVSRRSTHVPFLRLFLDDAKLKNYGSDFAFAGLDWRKAWQPVVCSIITDGFQQVKFPTASLTNISISYNGYEIDIS